MSKSKHIENELINKIQGTINDFDKPETINPLHDRMSANRKRFDSLKDNKSEFQKENENLLTNFKNTYEKWKKNLSEADRECTKQKEILFFIKQITEPIIENEAATQDKSSSSKESTKKSKTIVVKNDVESIPKGKKNSHQNIADTESLKNVLKVEINNLGDKLLKSILSIEEQGKTTFGTIDTKFKSIADNIVYEISKANKDQSSLSSIEESVESLPAKMIKMEDVLNKIEKKIDSTGSQALAAISSDIPEDEKAILELSKYMKDGLDQLENIARYHISKQREFEKGEKKAADLDVQIEEQKTNAYEEGKKEAKIELVKSIYLKHPDAFNKIKSVFGDIVSEKYDIGQTISVTNENKKNLAVTIDKIQEVGDYTIETIALLVNDEPLISATVKKIEV